MLFYNIRGILKKSNQILTEDAMKRFSILILTLCLCLTGCGKQTTEATAQIFAMDTVMEIAAYGPKAEKAVQMILNQ